MHYNDSLMTDGIIKSLVPVCPAIPREGGVRVTIGDGASSCILTATGGGTGSSSTTKPDGLTGIAGGLSMSSPREGRGGGAPLTGSGLGGERL